MTLVARVKVFGQTVRVFETSDKVEKHGFDPEHVNGVFDPEHNIIVLKSNLKHREKFRIFLHEVGHALLSRLGMHNTTLGHNLEELIVDSYATLLVEAFEIELKHKLKSARQSHD